MAAARLSSTRQDSRTPENSRSPARGQERDSKKSEAISWQSWYMITNYSPGHVPDGMDNPGILSHPGHSRDFLVQAPQDLSPGSSSSRPIVTLFHLVHRCEQAVSSIGLCVPGQVMFREISRDRRSSLEAEITPNETFLGRNLPGHVRRSLSRLCYFGDGEKV